MTVSVREWRGELAVGVLFVVAGIATLVIPEGAWKHRSEQLVYGAVIVLVALLTLRALASGRRSRPVQDLSIVEARAGFDPDADAAYFSFVDAVGPGEAVQQVCVEDERLRGEVILDLDPRGFLLGVEVLYASAQLRPATLQAASAGGVTVTLNHADCELAKEAVSELRYELTHYLSPPSSRGARERTRELAAKIEQLDRIHAILDAATV